MSDDFGFSKETARRALSTARTRAIVTEAREQGKSPYDTVDELFLATLMQEQTITQERLDGGTKKHNYLKVHRSNLGLCIRELIKVYEDRIALAANTSPLTV